MSDVLLLVPFESKSGYVLDAALRKTTGAHLAAPLASAARELEAALGVCFDAAPSIAGQSLDPGPHRSLTAVALATQLEAAGLDWEALDPGSWDLRQWSKALSVLARRKPKCVGVSTTFMTSRPWLDALLGLVRRDFPDAVLVVGGYFYTTDTQGFLELDADVYLVGEGETRFPELVRRVLRGQSLATIPGLYLRSAADQLEHTGTPPGLFLEEVSEPDFAISSRISPAHEPARLPYAGLETQRGCGFMCAFCTYRTLPTSAALSPEAAALRAARLPTSYVELYDATATAPRTRWRAFLDQCADAELGKKLGAFGRASDLDDDTVNRMARAGVAHVFIGQESGDQRMLNLMRKGTKLEQFQPALDALGDAGITVTLGLIHGFPGETSASLDATRSLLARVNARCPDHPTAFSYVLYPFALQDYAAIASDPELSEGSTHYFGYSSGDMDISVVCREILLTLLHTSRIPHAPVAASVFQRALSLPTSVISASSSRGDIFRWAKALECGVALFIGRDVFGKPIDRAELEALKPTLLAPFERRPSRRASLRSRVESMLIRGLAREWRTSPGATGPLTETLLWYLTPRVHTSARRTGAALHAERLLAGVDRRYRKLHVVGDAPVQ